MRSRKRCPFCRCLFTPDGRVASRQWACTKADCQARRRQQTQKQWREDHPDDRAARRLRAEIATAKATGKAPTPRAPPRGIPWDEMRDEISPQVLVILGHLVRLGVRTLQDEIRGQVLAFAPVSAASPPEDREDETAVRVAAG
jgi:hypothetical protein